MTDVLKMSTLKRSPPLAIVIFIERCDSLFQMVFERAKRGLTINQIDDHIPKQIAEEDFQVRAEGAHRA